MKTITTPKREDGYEIEFRGDPPEFYIYRATRWGALKSYLNAMHEGTADDPFVVVRVKNREELERARSAVGSWRYSMKLNAKTIRTATNGDNELWIWDTSRGTDPIQA